MYCIYSNILKPLTLFNILIMSLSLDGAAGISGVNGTASAPAIKGTTANTGIFFGTSTASVTAGGSERLKVDSSGLDITGNVASNSVAVSGYDIDCSLGNYFTKTCNGNSTFTISNVPTSRAFTIALEVTHTSGTLTWPAAIKWPADTAPTLTSGKTHLFVFVTDDGGTRWRGAAIVDYVN